MKKYMINVRRSSAAILFLVLIGAAVSALAQHPAIYLLDSEGEFINPMQDENADKPFSTKQTCGMCHDYDEISMAFHFQVGWDVISDDFGDSTGKPWNLSNGMMGKWCPMYFRQLAKKENEHEDEIDLTVYDFVGFSAEGDHPPCGACHAGGGGMEYDREGNRYDEYLAENPELRETLDGDYHNSNWDKSGVVEVDCLICHLEGYSFDERIAQLEEGNYRWAVVQASRLGFVDGSVRRGGEPTVTYNKRFFNEDGTITMKMSWPPPDDNCVFCHGRADVRKRGFSWNDIFNPDIHNQQGVSCVACHPAGSDHQIAKGNANALMVANDLDNTMLTCAECHEGGVLGATVPRHHSVRPSHLQAISCEACHIPSLKRAAALGMDPLTGSISFATNPLGAKEFGERAEWKPVYNRRNGHKIYPLNSMQATFWCNFDTDSLLYPLFLREHVAGWDLFSDQVTDDDEDGEPEVNTDEEIIAGLKAFSQSLQDNQRFTQVHPALVKGGKAYHLGDDGTLQELDYDVLPCISYSINHNVAPARMALGYNGCGDCHESDSHFFKGRRVIDLHGADGKPVTEAIGRELGCSPVSFAVNSFHQSFLSPMISIGIILVVFLMTLHYHSYGPKRIPFVPYTGEVKRFSLYERGIHLFRLLSFVLLTITGLILAFNWSDWQQLLFRSPQQLLWVHIVAGIVFILTTILGIFAWFRDAIFASYDKVWVQRIGGYLGHKGHVPSGRFNAGQKMFFWYTAIFGLLMSATGLILIFKPWFSLSVICMTSTIHNLVGFFLIAGVLSHAYLGTVANPGTWRVLVDGYVTYDWAHHHHPNWYAMLREKGLVPKDHGDMHDNDSETSA
ncbi:MAG: formate dehydrogenase subunit gamma [candidate division Zixibacteria bacterium]|nr:formate dehydrogenase subunit gamma [candidate division Zixibacteria bacterium]